ncbi:MAG: DUF1552 domain-containing protein, partial [Proteobacteria bacterium]
MKKRWELDRRTFLRCGLGGAATLMGLPVLEEMIGSIRKAEAAGFVDANFIGVFKPMACDRPSFFPSQYAQTKQLGKFTGSQWNMSANMRALEPFKEFTNVYAGVGYVVKGQDHDEEACRWLTGLSAKNYDFKTMVQLDTSGASGQTGKSIDQYIADHLYNSGNSNRGKKHSMQLISDFDPNLWSYRNVVSFENGDKPLFGEYDVQRLFDSMFFGFNPGSTAVTLTERQTRKRNVLDEVWTADTKSLISKLSSASKNSVQQYLTSIEDVKKKIDALVVPGNPMSCRQPARPGTIRGSGTPGIHNDDYQKHVEIMMDLMVIALQCNMTKVVTYMFGPGQGAYRAWKSLINLNNEPDATDIGNLLSQQWHDWSHYENQKVGSRANQLVDIYHLERLAYLASRLKEAGLLEKTFLLY